MTEVQRSPQPLSGVRVVELGIWIQGPLAAQILGDLGAEVIKIERPAGGDFSRGLTSLYGVPLRGDEHGGLLWQVCNRNKRSFALNLKRPQGRDILSRLLKKTDVFLTNLQPSVLDSLGAAPSEVMAINPQIIYALGSGLALEGELADIPCQDTTAMAFSGFMYAVANGSGVPYYPPGAMIDILAASNLAACVTAALHQRSATGTGQIVNTSLLHSALWLQLLNVATIENQHTAMPPFDRTNVANPLMNLYRCSDGKWLALGMLIVDSAGWRALCKILRTPELATDDRFNSNRNRKDNSRPLIAILDDLISRRTRDEFVAEMAAARLPCTPVLTPEEVLLQPGVRAQSLIHKTRQGTRFLKSPLNLSGNLPSYVDAPGLGEATFDLLQDLGVTSEQFAELREEGVVF